jgi:hypothetical protein
VTRRVAIATVFFVLLFFLAGPASAQDVPLVSQTLISGGGLPHPVRLTVVDEDDFMRRINLPPQLEDAPDVSGPSYTVSSPYWDHAVRGEESKDPEVELEATYYPDGGFVRTRQDGEDVWIVIDLRQRAILDRYIRLDKDGSIDEAPGPLNLITAAVKDGEDVTVRIGSLELDADQAAAFWRVADGLEVYERADPVQPTDGPGSVWITFNLPEGRTEQMLYIVANGEIYDRLGATSYVVPFLWLQPVLGDQAPRPGQPIDFASPPIEQEQSTGSPIWWVVMIGGGLACLGAAVWLRRRLA